MENKIREIAERIKELREILEISADEMAVLTGVSAEEYQHLESGESDFSFTFIFKCAQRFGVDVTDLLKGSSPRLTSYSVVRRGGGLPITRRKGFQYRNIAPLFKDRLAQPFYVTVPYSEEEQTKPVLMSRHKGQEINIILHGTLKFVIDGHTEYLGEGDTVYYSSDLPHGMIAAKGADCEFISIVINSDGSLDYNQPSDESTSLTRPSTPDSGTVADEFIETHETAGVFSSISFRNDDNFNFAFDVVDKLAHKCPNKECLVYLHENGFERRFTFDEMNRYSSQTANYFASLGIGRGDRVMLVLKRHYQFWFSILALHKLGAIVIPATNQLVQKDFDYRFRAAGVKAIVCTADGDVAMHAENAAKDKNLDILKIIVGAPREGWHDFNADLPKFSDSYPRPADAACGNDSMLMFFTSGTTGYPKIATHSFKYPLGHYPTAKYWHNVDPDGIHLTIADTGWGKALWGKLYGQWLCEAAVFVYDFDRFHSDKILPLFAKYQITTFCAPPTMYRFFIKEDLSKYDLSSLKYATIAGEALNPEVFNSFYKSTGIKLMESFGQTETTLVVGNFVGMTPKPGSMGKPSPLYDVDIILPDGTSAACGETGEIVIKTNNGAPCGLFKEYYLDSERTQEAWHDNVFHTGDTAWRDEDGYYWYVGRIDDLIKSSGYRIGPFEIESVIMELPYVLECAVTAAPDEIRGQVVKASIVLTSGTTGSDSLVKEIQSYVKSHTAPYKYPRIVEFVTDLPKTISGKIRRAALRSGDSE